ncbi:MAG TPA: DUF2723 domain-containing protein, partial [Anaerolineae bacterium]
AFSIQHSPILLFLTVLISTFTLYLLTLAPGVVGGDAGEHQFTGPLLGIPHATGYPLYVLVSKLWTLLIPIGTLAWRMNLLSAVGGALAAATTALVVYRLTTAGDSASPTSYPRAPAWVAGLTAGLVLACGLTLWQWSTMAGVRSINVLFFSLMTLAAIVWQQQRRRGDQQAAERSLRWLALIVGLSLAHHRTTLFYLPSLVAWIGWHDRKLLAQPKRLLILLGLSLAPLLLYGFTYLRGINNPPYSHERITDWQSFWFLVGAGDSSGLFLSIDPAYLAPRLAFIWRDILAQLSLPGVILACLGGLRLLWRQTRHFFFQGLLVLILLLFTLDFEVVNLNEAPTWYLMPAYFVMAVWLGVGVFEMWDVGCGMGDERWAMGDWGAGGGEGSRFMAEVSRYRRAWLYLFALSLIGLLSYSLVWPNWQRIYADSTGPLDEWRQLLRGTQAQRFVESSLPYLEPGSLILGDWEQYPPFKYYQLINGVRPDITPRLPLDRWPEQVAAARAAGQPVYFARKTTDLIGTPYLSMAGPLIHLQTAPSFEVPQDINLLNANFENELELIGYHLEVMPQLTPGGAQAGPIIQLLLYWRVPHAVEWDYALSLRLLDAKGQEIYKRDATHPVLSSYPTTLWTPGEVVGDFYELPFPPGHGPLSLQLIPYRTEGPGQWHNLTLNGSEPVQEGIVLGPVGEK